MCARLHSGTAPQQRHVEQGGFVFKTRTWTTHTHARLHILMQFSALFGAHTHIQSFTVLRLGAHLSAAANVKNANFVAFAILIA